MTNRQHNAFILIQSSRFSTAMQPAYFDDNWWRDTLWEGLPLPHTHNMKTTTMVWSDGHWTRMIYAMPVPAVDGCLSLTDWHHSTTINWSHSSDQYYILLHVWKLSFCNPFRLLVSENGVLVIVARCIGADMLHCRTDNDVDDWFAIAQVISFDRQQEWTFLPSKYRKNSKFILHFFRCWCVSLCNNESTKRARARASYKLGTREATTAAAYLLPLIHFLLLITQCIMQM